MTQFAPRLRSLSSDSDIWQEVFDRNEYRVPALSPTDVVLDVGAHIGAFTCACLARGARRVVSFEPDPSSFLIAKENIATFMNTYGCSGCPDLRNVAVWRSDRQESLRISNARFNSILCNFHPAAQCTLFRDPDATPVHSIGLDSVLGAFPQVAILKLDCEGAEWPILFTSTQLHKVGRLLVEVHSLAWKAAESGRMARQLIVKEFESCTPHGLKELLGRVGLNCIRDTVHYSYLNNPEFYFGILAFENEKLTGRFA